MRQTQFHLEKEASVEVNKVSTNLAGLLPGLNDHWRHWRHDGLRHLASPLGALRHAKELAERGREGGSIERLALNSIVGRNVASR
jgi:hypothetical protein